MTPGERDQLADLCARRAGVRMEADADQLQARLGAVARREGYLSVGDLLGAMRDRGEERLVSAVVEALLPSRSVFFRDPAVFEAVAARLRKRASKARVSMWSAGCSSGQEAYSLAMLLAEHELSMVEVFASDLNDRLLGQARSGRYSQFEVQLGLSSQRLVRHFTDDEDGFVISTALRDRVKWRRHNLLAPPPGRFDIVLCRYVLGWMLPTAQERALCNLLAALKPGGLLVLGADERPRVAAGLIQASDSAGAFEAAASLPTAA